MNTHTLTFHESGEITGIKTETLPLDSLGSVTYTRASHIWPVNPVKRFFFRFIRFIGGDRTSLAAWTRRWYGPWEVRFVDRNNPRRPGAVVFTHQSRRVCLAWEHEQLNGNV